MALLLAGLLTGAAVADDAPRTVLSVNFGKAGPEQVLPADAASKAALTSDPAEEAGGARSLKGDSRGSGAEWNEFIHSKSGLFPAREGYKISFDYKVIARAGGANFYTLLRRAGGGGDQGWREWRGEPGATGHVETTLSARDGDDIVIIGIHNAGALAVNNIVIQTDPAIRPAPISTVIVNLPAPRRTWKSPGRTAYYVDSTRGSDGADGRSPRRAWRTLGRVNAGTFAPGDEILLRAGSAWYGFLSPGGSGAAGRPIELGRYGAGPKPKVDGQGKFLATLYLHNAEQWEVGGLDIANKGKSPQPNLAGVRVGEDDFGDAHHVTLRDLDVHDVTGSNVKGDGGGSGISCTCGGAKERTRFDGLTIENCHLTRTDRNGITMFGNCVRDASWYPSLRVVIRGNLLEDIGGDGIVPIGCDGARVERNVLHGGRMRAQDYAAGIWPWSCDNTVVEYNEVSGMRGTNDGEGYDSDYNCRDSLFQYNYSHDNDGGFLLICDDGSQSLPWNAGNSGTVVRYNVSVNDGLHTFNITGPCRNTSIYNNVFYVGRGRSVALVNGGNWGNAWPADTRFVNNIFYVDGQAKFDLGGMTATAFDHNSFWGDLQNRPDDPHAVLADPKLVAPGSLAPADYRPRPGSPCLRAGVVVPDPGPHGFLGSPVLNPPNIGAFQHP